MGVRVPDRRSGFETVTAVRLQAIALAALDQLLADRENQVFFPSPRGGYLDLHNFRNAAAAQRRRSRQRKQRLSRRKPKAL